MCCLHRKCPWQQAAAVMFSGTSTSAVLLGDLSFTDGNELLLLLLLFILTSASNVRLLHPAQLGFLTFG